MKKIITSIIPLVTIASLLVGAPKKDIVDTAADSGSFKTLVAAIKAAGLVETLKGEGPFTVFAPTDDAFAKLPSGTIDSLLKPENKDKLFNILTYHVVPGMVKAKKAAKLDSAKTVNGAEIVIKSTGETLTINNSKVIKADLKSSNGIIHVIDAVLIPEPKEVSSSTNHIINDAINKGVPMFNSGNHAQTAVLYMKAGSEILGQCESSACTTSMQVIKSAMQKASGESCPTSQAWIMRHAFDQVLASVN